MNKGILNYGTIIQYSLVPTEGKETPHTDRKLIK